MAECVAEWLKPRVRMAVGSNLALDRLVAVRNSCPGRPEPCEGNLVAAAGSCGGLMVKHPWPLLEISLSDFRRLATLNINTYLPNTENKEILELDFTAGGGGAGSKVYLEIIITFFKYNFSHICDGWGVYITLNFLCFYFKFL